MKVNVLLPQPIEKVQFKLSSYKYVPKDCGCYVLTTFDNDILYIGLSDNLLARFKKHLDTLEKTSPTKEGRAVWFYFLKYSANNLTKLERSWLNIYEIEHGELPTLNKVHSPIK